MKKDPYYCNQLFKDSHETRLSEYNKRFSAAVSFQMVTSFPDSEDTLLRITQTHIKWSQDLFATGQERFIFSGLRFHCYGSLGFICYILDQTFFGNSADFQCERMQWLKFKNCIYVHTRMSINKKKCMQHGWTWKYWMLNRSLSAVVNPEFDRPSNILQHSTNRLFSCFTTKFINLNNTVMRGD